MTSTNHHPGLYQSYQWLVPPRFSMAEACCARWALSGADARRIAIYAEDQHGQREIWTFERLYDTTLRLQHAFKRMGIQAGDTVAIVLPQRGEFVAALCAVWQLGACAVPLSPSLPTAQLELCLRDARVCAAVIDDTAREAVMAVQHRCQTLKQILGIDFADERAIPWRGLLARQPGDLLSDVAEAHTPALLMYGFDANNKPHGVVHSHAVLVGVLPGFVAAHEWFPQHGKAFYTSLDWASIMGLLHGVLPCLYFGRPIIAYRGPWQASRTVELLQRYRVSHFLSHPHALRQLQRHSGVTTPAELPELRCLSSTGQRLSLPLQKWFDRHWDLTINNIYGCTQAPAIVGTSHDKWPSTPGSLGRPYPGHRVEVVDDERRVLPPGSVGHIVVLPTDRHDHPDPALALGHWPELEPLNSHGGVATGDLGWFDDDDCLWLAGHTSELLRFDHGTLDPQILEDILADHLQVADAAVTARYDDLGLHWLRAWILPEPSVGEERTELTASLREHVALHWPRIAQEVELQFEWVEALPRMPSGRVWRTLLRPRTRDRRRRRRRPTPQPA